MISSKYSGLSLSLKQRLLLTVCVCPWSHRSTITRKVLLQVLALVNKDFRVGLITLLNALKRNLQSSQMEPDGTPQQFRVRDGVQVILPSDVLLVSGRLDRESFHDSQLLDNCCCSRLSLSTYSCLMSSGQQNSRQWDPPKRKRIEWNEPGATHFIGIKISFIHLRQNIIWSFGLILNLWCVCMHVEDACFSGLMRIF